MTILEMLEREDIYSILEKTMSDYYATVYNKSVIVKIKKKNFGKYNIFPRLGVIIPRIPSFRVIKSIYVEFDVQNNLAKKLFAWAYITLCIMTFGLLASAVYEISDETVFNKDMVIIPGNRKIKIFNYKKEIVDSILKEDFNDYYFQNELRVRKSSKYPFILPIEQFGKRWYRERLLSGRCLVRTSGSEYDKYLDEVIRDLRKIQEDTIIKISAQQYIKNLSNEYLTMIDDIVRHKGITCKEKLLRVIDWCNCSVDENVDMYIASSHGDMQTGNIYIDETRKKLYIIDWETEKKRSTWYDALTVIYSIRRKNKFSDLINSLDEKSVQTIIKMFGYDLNCNTNIVRKVLLIEELGFFVEEIIDLPGKLGKEIIERFEFEIDRINCLKEDI